MNGPQDVIPPVIISAVFDPNERPRWERILHEMLVESRKPSSESIQIFKVRRDTNTRVALRAGIETRAFEEAPSPSGADPRCRRPRLTRAFFCGLCPQVRLLKLGVTVMAMVQSRLMLLDNGNYFCMVFALTPLPSTSSIPAHQAWL